MISEAGAAIEATKDDPEQAAILREEADEILAAEFQADADLRYETLKNAKLIANVSEK